MFYQKNIFITVQRFRIQTFGLNKWRVTDNYFELQDFLKADLESCCEVLKFHIGIQCILVQRDRKIVHFGPKQLL